MTNIISVDLGGTSTRIARFTDKNTAKMDGAPIKRRNSHVYEDDLNFIVETARSLSDGMPIDALGIGVPGRVCESKLDMVSSNNLSEWANRSFCSDLSQNLDCSIYMDNDGIAAALGEVYFGYYRDDFHYLIWGTGISGVSIKRENDEIIDAVYIRRNFKSFLINGSMIVVVPQSHASMENLGKSLLKKSGWT